MPAKNEDLHGNVPDRAEVALLLIDVINDLEFAGSQPLDHGRPAWEEAGKGLAALGCTS